MALAVVCVGSGHRQNWVQMNEAVVACRDIIGEPTHAVQADLDPRVLARAEQPRAHHMKQQHSQNPKA